MPRRASLLSSDGRIWRKSRRIGSWPESPRSAGTKLASLSSSTWPPLVAAWAAAIVLDVDPAQARLHRQILLEHLGRGESLREDVAAVEDQHHGRMVHLAVDLGQDQAIAAHEVRFHLEAESQVGAVKGLGDVAQAVDDLRKDAPADRFPWDGKTRNRGSASSRRRGPARRPSARRWPGISRKERRRSSCRPRHRPA